MIVDILIKPEEDGAEIGTALARASSSSISFCFCCSRWARVGTMPASSRAAIPKYPADASWIGVGFSFPICHSLMIICQVDSGMAARRKSFVFSVAPIAARNVRRGLAAASSASTSSAQSQRSFAVRKVDNSSAVGSMVT